MRKNHKGFPNMPVYEASGFWDEHQFSDYDDVKEELTQFLSNHTCALLAIGKYCLDKAVDMNAR